MTMSKFGPAMIILVIAPMITGSISFIASASLIAMILLSNLKLSTIYRRLIFGISVFDLVQSLSQAASSFPMPVGSTWAAIGNDTTCDLQGFTTVVGTLGSLLYSLSLSVYFLFVVKFEMSETEIKRCIEPFLHIFPCVYAITVGIFFCVKQFYNVNDSVCWFNPPQWVECLEEGVLSKQECFVKSKPQLELIVVLFGIMMLVTVVANVIIMCTIWYVEYSISSKFQRMQRTQRRNMQRSSRRSIATNVQAQEGSNNTHRPSSRFYDRLFHRNSSRTGSILEDRLSRPSRASLQRRKQIIKRATAYIFGLILTYSFALVYRWWQGGNEDNQAPFVLQFLSRTFYPLQGFFNLLVYTFPHASSYRHSHGVSWSAAFYSVIKKGGDNDRLMPLQRSRRFGRHRNSRRGTMRNEPIVTEIETFENRDIERGERAPQGAGFSAPPTL